MGGTQRREPTYGDGIDRIRRVVMIRMRRQASDLAHDFSHVERVWKNAKVVAAHCCADEDVDIDLDALEAACLLHEIGRGAERRGESRADACARIAEEMLRSEGLGELVWPVCEAITQHLMPGRAIEAAEARVLHDADLLEDLGAIGLARTISEAAAHATPLLYDPDDPGAENRDLDEATHVLDRLPKRHFHLADSMTTAWGLAEGRRRTRILAAYHKAFLREAGFA